MRRCGGECYDAMGVVVVSGEHHELECLQSESLLLTMLLVLWRFGVVYHWWMPLGLTVWRDTLSTKKTVEEYTFANLKLDPAICIPSHNNKVYRYLVSINRFIDSGIYAQNRSGIFDKHRALVRQTNSEVVLSRTAVTCIHTCADRLRRCCEYTLILLMCVLIYGNHI